MHCAAAFVISSDLTEVVLFGGTDKKSTELSDTTILRMGEFCNEDANLYYYLLLEIKYFIILYFNFPVNSILLLY